MCAHFIQPQLATRAASLKETIWMRIGDLQSVMNDRDRSLDAFERVLLVNPGNIHAMTQIGLVLAKKERYPQALAYLQRAVAADPSCGEAWSVLAHCYFMTDDLPKSYQAYQNALNHSQDPSPNLWYGIGQLYERYGSADHALETFLAVLRMAPNFERAIEVCFYIGTIYKEQRKFDQAIQYFEKISLAPNPPPPLTRADAWHHIGHVNELKADIPKALEMYKRALNENPRHAKTLQNLGWLEHFHKNNSREAIRRLQMSLEADQNDAQAWYLLGRVCMDLGEVQQAFDAYQQAIIRDGHNANFWCAIGVLYYQQNQYRDAMDAYTKSIHLNPSVSETWDDLATLYESQGQRQHAITAYRRAAELSPEKTHIQERLNALQNSINHPQQQHTSSLPMPPQPHPAHPRSLPPQALPPVTGHSQNPNIRPLPNSQSQHPPPHLQPLGINPTPGSHPIAHQQQQPLPMLTHSTGHQTLPVPGAPRHIMQHPLQPPAAAQTIGSTGFSQSLQPPQGLPANHLRSTLPHLTTPTHGELGRPNSSQSHPQQGPPHVPLPLSGATQRITTSEQSRTICPPVGQPNSNGNSIGIGNRPNPLLQPLPQLPGLQSSTNANTQATHPGSVKPGEAPPPGDNNNNNSNQQQQQPPLPMLKVIPGKDGTLERIPSLHGQRPAIHPIPSLAPLVQGDGNKQGGNTNGNSEGPRLPPAGPVSQPFINSPLKNSTLPPLQHQGGKEHGSTLPAVAAISANDAQNNGNNNNTAGTEGSKDTKREAEGDNDNDARPNGTSSNNNSNSGHEDAKLLQSMALSTHGIGSEAKRSLLNSTPLPVALGASSSSPISGPMQIPALPIPNISSIPNIPSIPSIPRSAPAPPKNAMNSGPLGASSLTTFGRSATPVHNSKLPSTLPSPLAQPKHNSGISMPNSSAASIGGSAQRSSSPLSSSHIGKSASNEALQLPRPLTSLPPLTKANNNNSNNEDGNVKVESPTPSAGIKSPNATMTDVEKRPDASNSSLNKATFGIPRSVPISSITGNNDGKNTNNNNNSTSMDDGDNNGNNGNAQKREVSPSADSEKRYKRPRVGDNNMEGKDGNGNNNNNSGRRRGEEENGQRQRKSSNDYSANGKDDGNSNNNNSGNSNSNSNCNSNSNSKRSLGTSIGMGAPPRLAIPNNAPLPSFRSSRMKMGSKGNSPLLRPYSIPKSKPIVTRIDDLADGNGNGNGNKESQGTSTTTRNGYSNSNGNGNSNSEGGNSGINKTASESTGAAS